MKNEEIRNFIMKRDKEKSSCASWVLQEILNAHFIVYEDENFESRTNCKISLSARLWP